MQIGIKKLTSAQKRKLRAGKQIRIYTGTGMNIDLSDTQYKKCHRNFKKGSGYPISTFRFNLYSYNVNHLNIVTDVVSIGSF